MATRIIALQMNILLSGLYSNSLVMNCTEVAPLLMAPTKVLKLVSENCFVYP